jgi:hypothetical protein
MKKPATLHEIATIHEPDAGLIAELEALLEAAKAGTLRGVLFCAYRNGSDAMRFGSAELELDSIVTGADR